MSLEDNFQDQIRLLLGLLKQAGYQGAWLTIDGLEKWPTNNAKRIEQMLEALLSSLAVFDPKIPQTPESPVWIFKFFVPLSIKDTLEQTSGINRHRAKGLKLRYKEKQLQELLSKRVRLHTMNTFQFPELSQDKAFFEWFDRYAGENPRAWLRLGYPFIESYLKSKFPLSPEAWKEIVHQKPPQMRLDLLNQQIWVGEHRLEIISPTEFCILGYLYQHKERVCSLEEIYYHCIENMEHIPRKDEAKWVHKDIWRPALDTTVWRIRQKLEPNSKKPIYLLTVPRKGLRLHHADIL
jgi:DNA-binding winged helix-turn-helix (wHTH) protein